MDDRGACGVDVTDVLSLGEFEEHARRYMSHMAYEFVAAGAADEHTLRWNRESFDRMRLRPRVLQDVATVDTRVTLFGHTMESPIILAPTAYHRALHPDGELETARGAGAAGATFVVSTATTTPLEDIASAASAPLWFQLYLQPDRAATKELVECAVGAGYKVLCLTVDTPVQGARNRQTRAAFGLPEGVTAMYMSQLTEGRPLADSRRGAAATWKDVEWLRSIVNVPLLLKGILTGDDAECGIGAGADGIAVSNHGARNLDTVPATIDALAEVTDRVARRVPVMVDGGIRRGTDIVKAIALGADAVMIGRPYLFALSVAGAAGIQRTVAILRDELEMALKLVGRRALGDLDRTVLW